MAKGRSLNLLALPKTKEMMRIFTAPTGMILGQFDLSSIEPRILSQYSGDPKMSAICGVGGFEGHDMYLVGGMDVPGLGDRIKAVYDFNNPTVEAVAAAKKMFKTERAEQLKPSFLGWQYGLGYATLSTKTGMSPAEARTLLRGLDRAFPGKARLQKQLEAEWVKRGGYIINGRGLPMAVDFGSKKDLVSRFVQGTAHTVLLRLIYFINLERKRRKIPTTELRPYICDIHDESVWAMRPGVEDSFRELVEYAFDQVRGEFGWVVPLKHGGINFGPDLSIRCED